MKNNEIYGEIKNILLTSKKPSIEIKKMIEDGFFDIEPFNIIKLLSDIEQNIKYHKEGNVLNHTLLVIDKASELKEKSTNQEVFMISALLHDIGKLKCTKVKNGKITSYNHDIESSKLVREFLDGLETSEVIDKVSNLTRYHMQILYFTNNPKQIKTKDIIENTEIYDLYLLGIADRLGRIDPDEENELQEAKKFLEFLENKRQE